MCVSSLLLSQSKEYSFILILEFTFFSFLSMLKFFTFIPFHLFSSKFLLIIFFLLIPVAVSCMVLLLFPFLLCKLQCSATLHTFVMLVHALYFRYKIAVEIQVDRNPSTKDLFCSFVLFLCVCCAARNFN